MAKKTKFPSHTVDLASCRFSNTNEFSLEYGNGYSVRAADVGSLDAPNLLPAGATRRYLSIDTVREKILAWPEAMTIHREAR